MKKKIVLTILAVSIVALLIGGAASAFYTAESEDICVSAQALEIGVLLCGPDKSYDCIWPGWCTKFCDAFWLKTSCDCVPGLQLYAKPVIDDMCVDSTLADNVLVRVYFDKGGAMWLDWTPVSELKDALDAKEAAVFACCAGELNKKLYVCFDLWYPETCKDQSEDMGEMIKFCYKIQAQTVPGLCGPDCEPEPGPCPPPVD